MIKPTNKPTIETIEQLTPVLDFFRDAEVTVGDGSTVWTLSSGYISGSGGWSADRGCYPSAIVRLTRKDHRGEPVQRQAHLNQIRLVK